jgi:hypothetical protein
VRRRVRLWTLLVLLFAGVVAVGVYLAASPEPGQCSDAVLSDHPSADCHP